MPRIRGVGTTTNQAAGGSITVNKPANVVAKDVLFAFIWNDKNLGASATVTTPAGWTLLATAQSSGFTANQYRLSVYYRVSDGTDGASYTWTFGASQSYSTGTVVAYTDVDQVTPNDVAVQLSAVQDMASTTQTNTGVTTTTKNAKILSYYIDESTASTLTSPAGFAQVASVKDTTNAMAFALYEKTQNGTGATGGIAATGFTTGSFKCYAGAVVAIRSR